MGGTLKKGIEGSRRAGMTNPLNPRYKMLDGDVRPQPVPVFDAERNIPTHSLVQSRAQASSLPNLHARVSSQLATPIGSVPGSQRSLQRDTSEPMLRRSLRGSPASSQRSGGGRYQNRPPSGMGTPYGQAPPGSTIRPEQLPSGRSSGQRTPVSNGNGNYSYSPQNG